MKNEHGLKITSTLFLGVRFYYVEKNGSIVESFTKREDAINFIKEYKVT